MKPTTQQDQQLLTQAQKGITQYLERRKNEGLITGSYFETAIAQTVPSLSKWLLADQLDIISPNLRDGLRKAIAGKQWEGLTNAFSREVSFGTGGIREKMGADRKSVLSLKNEGVHAPVIKGPNTINDVTLLLTSAGVAQFGLSRKPPLTSVVVGFDTRVCGSDFARLIAQLFLAYNYTVYLFDQPCMYPSVTYAVPTLKADMGIFISASHNDFRYNGFKLSCQNGSQFDPVERAELYKNYIKTVTFDDIKRIPLQEARGDRLWFLGGVHSSKGRVVEDGPLKELPLADPLPNASTTYAGGETRIIDLHTMHANHIKSFLMNPGLITGAKQPLSIGFCAFNGAGREAVPRLLGEIGFDDVKRIMKLDPPDGMFPAFCSDPGREQQPDPGDYRAADIAVEAFKKEYGQAWDKVDLILGTDPDADRCGVIVKIPEHQRIAFPHPATGERRDYALLSADEIWTLMLWYRLKSEAEQYGAIRDADRKFIVLSHTTTDLLMRLSRKYGLGVIKTWVGFAQLAAATRAAWDLSRGKDTEGITQDGCFPDYEEGCLSANEKRVNRTIHSWEGMEGSRRCINIAALEQSNGFSLLGGAPPDARSLGEGGHVRDKDGTFAAVLVAELAAYAKEQGTNLIDLLDKEIYSNPDIGLYITRYEPDPMDGEYEGLAGYTKKREILDKAGILFEQSVNKPITFGGLKTTGATVYCTGKYDAINWPGFPDEGYRFFFDDEHRSHLTIRPSGTSNALRFHVQLFGGHPSRDGLIQAKADLRAIAQLIVADIRQKIGTGETVRQSEPVAQRRGKR